MKLVFLLPLYLFVSHVVIAQNLYDIPNITLIEIEFEESNWDELLDTYYADEMDERLIATCSINGEVFDSVGVKYKGNSTYSETNAKNPLNIKLDHVKTQRYQGYETLKLSNIFKDPSAVREVLGYEIGRKYMDMPLSNYAKVYINDEFIGLYSSSESINSDYIERRLYGDNDNTRVKCNPDYGSGSPNLMYLGTDSSLYYTSYEMKSDYGWGDVIDLCQTLQSDVNSVDTILDVDRALWMIAYDNIFSNLDSYIGPLQQNYYLLKDNNGRLCPIIWDLNQNFGSFTMIDGGGPGSGPPDVTDLTEMDPYLREGDTDWPLVQQLLSVPRYRKMYMAHFRTMYEENLEDGSYYTRAEELQDIVDAEVSSDPNYFYSYIEFNTNLDDQVGSPGPGGGQVYGVAQILDGRESYLSTHPDLSLTQPTISDINTGTADPYSTVTITADIADANYAFLAYRYYKGDVFTKVEMFDDGAHGDGSAGDGVYGVDIPTTAADMQYYIYAENADAGKFSPRRAEHEFYHLAVEADVVINEMQPKNNGTVYDQDGEYDDWVELYNTSSSTVDLTGFYLSDDIANLTQWQFPDGAYIDANDYLIIWLDKDTTQDGLHANFKLSSDGDSLFLSDASGIPVNEVVSPKMEASTTFGRYPNGTGDFIRMRSTFDAENSYTTIGIDENEVEEAEVLLYPNPVSDVLTINSTFEESVNMEVYDLRGQILYSNSHSGTTQLSVGDWNSGFYLLTFPEKGIVRKFVVR